MFKRKKSQSIGNKSAASYAKWLGIASYALGIVQLFRPGSVNRLIGVPDHNPNHTVQRLIGVREMISGTGVLFGKNTSGWMWSRVAGDVMDASIVGGTLAASLGTRRKLIPALGAFLGILVLDAMVAIRTRGK